METARKLSLTATERHIDVTGGTSTVQRVGYGHFPCAKPANGFLEESSARKFRQDSKCRFAGIPLASAVWLPQVRINIHARMQNAHDAALIPGLHSEKNQMPTLPKFEHLFVP